MLNHLSERVLHDLAVLRSHHGVPDDAVVPRGHDDHLGRGQQDLLVVLADEGERAGLDAGRVGRVVQHVHEVEGGHAEEGAVVPARKGAGHQAVAVVVVAGHLVAVGVVSWGKKNTLSMPGQNSS